MKTLLTQYKFHSGQGKWLKSAEYRFEGTFEAVQFLRDNHYFIKSVTKTELTFGREHDQYSNIIKWKLDSD